MDRRQFIQREETEEEYYPFRLIRGEDPKYYHKFVAITSFTDTEVVAFDEDPLIVFQEAIKKGHKSPVIFFVPDPNRRYYFLRRPS